MGEQYAPHGYTKGGKPKQKFRTRTHIPHDSVKCGAKCHSGRLCVRWAVRGGERCLVHGGKQQMLPPGDPRRQGRPPVIHTDPRRMPIHVYSERLTPELKAAYDAADLFGMDEEVRVACAMLQWAMDEFQQNPKGGVITGTSTKPDGSKTVSIRPYSEVIQEHLKIVRTLKNARLQTMDAAMVAKHVQALVAKAMEMTVGDGTRDEEQLP